MLVTKYLIFQDLPNTTSRIANNLAVIKLIRQIAVKSFDILNFKILMLCSYISTFILILQL